MSGYPKFNKNCLSAGTLCEKTARLKLRYEYRATLVQMFFSQEPGFCQFLQTLKNSTFSCIEIV